MSGVPGDRARRPSAIRTFLIADIRGYTRFTDQHGDEAASRLATTFAQIVAEAVEAWDGRLVELRGDEALCTFDSPRAALRCAMELQQTFAEEAAQAPDLPLRVGIGLDVGEAVPVRDGYRGAALNLAARLCSGAEAGEIRATQNLAHVAGPIPGLVYEPQGSEQLKGVAAEVAIVRVRPAAEGASTPSPPVASAGRSTEPLPAELESTVPLVGRQGDLLWLRWHWRRARLGHGAAVEVAGPEGIGKTRLVAELARQAHAEGAAVRLDPAPDHLGGDAGPVLAIFRDPRDVDDLEAETNGRAILAIVERRESDSDGRRSWRLLGPLTEADVAAIAALYADDADDAPPVRRLLEESGGIPMAVHRVASQWARSAAMHRMGESARRTSRERRGLREAEEELIGRYADLAQAHERSRRYAVDESTIGPGVCPYKGLAAYEAADAEYYFGRERLIGELVARVVGSSFVGLVGASGSGKSSVLSAGLLPALRSGVLPGSSEWIQVPMRPGTRPMEHLADALRRGLPDGLPADAEAESVLRLATARMGGAQRLLVVIDQFEEVFAADASQRDRFIDLITASHPSLKVVLAVRADQYETCAQFPQLARLLAADQVLVGPLRSEEVAAIARHPAERVGLQVEPELVEALIGDLGTEPGAMPLLSTALLELWEARDGGRLTLSAYLATGGVRGAVARLAESAYARLDPGEQDAARTLFLRLVGEGSEPDTIVRRRLPMAELESIGDARISTVVEKLTLGRLLTRDEGTVEVAHEALIREWPRLRDWIEADAAGREVRLHLIETARTWDGGGRGEEDLYRGARLATALEWSGEREAELNAVERDFLAASRATAEQAAERQRRTNRILRGLLAGAGVLLLAAVGAGAFAWVQAGQNAENASVAQVRELSLSALALTSEDPQLALLLASEAVQLSRDAGRAPPAQALQAIWSAYVAGKSTTTIAGVGARAVAYSPDGATLAVDASESPDTLVSLRDPVSGEEVGSLPRSDEIGEVESIAYSPNGRWVAVSTSGATGAAEGSVSVFDWESRERVHRLAEGHDGYRDVTVTDAGLLSAAGVRDNQQEIEAVTWDVATGDVRAVIGTVPGILNSDLRYLSPLAVDLHPTTGQLVFGAVSEFEGTTGFIVGLSLPAEVLRCPVCPEARPALMKALDVVPDLIAVSPDGLRIAVGDIGSGRITVIDPLLGAPVFEPVSYRGPRSITWSPDGARLAVSGGDSVVVLDAAVGTTVVSVPSRGASVLAASFRAGTDQIAAASSAGRLHIHRTTPTGGDLATLGMAITRATAAGGSDVLVGRGLADLAVLTDHIVLSLAGAGVAVLDRETTTELHSRDLVVDARIRGHVAKDAGSVTGMYANGSAAVIDAATLRELARLPGCAAPTGISADGQYIVLSRSLGLADVCADGEATAGVFDVTEGALSIEYGAEHLPHGAISAAGSSGASPMAAVIVYEDPASAGRLDLWDLDTGELVASIDETARPGFVPSFVAFSPDGRYLAVGGDGPRALVLEVATLATGASLAEATVFDREVNASRTPKVAVTSDATLVTASGDGVYRFWSLESGDLTMQIETTELVGEGSFDFSPDFSSFYYEDGGGVIRHMPMDVDEMIELAESLITRSLTDAECREYLHTDTCGEEE